MKEPTQADYEAGRILHQAWYNVGRAIAPPFDLIDKFDRLRWIETAKVSNAAQPPLLAQPEQEPVFLIYDDAGGWIESNESEYRKTEEVNRWLLYTTPPKRPWVGLTDGEIYKSAQKSGVLMRGVTSDDALDLAQAIEAKLKEKNT